MTVAGGGVLLRPGRRERRRGGRVLRLDRRASSTQALPDKADAALFRKVYGADGKPNFEEKYHILRLPKPLAEAGQGPEADRGASCRRSSSRCGRSCSTARAKRPRPFLDTKVLTAWNGQMIAGLRRRRRRRSSDKEYIDGRGDGPPTSCCKTLRTKDGRLLRTYGTPGKETGEALLNGYLDDYAFLVHGLLHCTTRRRSKSGSTRPRR